MKYLILYGMRNTVTAHHMQLYDDVRKLTDCAIILFEDAVITGLKSVPKGDQSLRNPIQNIVAMKIPVYCIQEDLQARGFGSDHLLENIRPISYLDSIALIEQAEKLISWL